MDTPISHQPRQTGRRIQSFIPWRLPAPVDHEKPEPVATGWRVAFRRLASYLGGALDLFPFAVGLRRRLNAMPPDFHPHEVDEDFFGINVAPGPTADHNRFVLERLRELGVRRVRVNHGYAEAESGVLVPPFVRELHAAGFKVLLNLVPPTADAIGMCDPAVGRRWATFCERALGELGPHIDACEIGSTVNRFTWSGWTHATYVQASALAEVACRARGVARYGPNVTDFEPLENMCYLGAMRRHRCLPAVHTDNLFVDRANQPEASDPNVAGVSAARRVAFDTVGKARLLSAIGLVAGVPRRFVSTFADWVYRTVDEPRKRCVSLEQYARYLTRYLVLGAASGHLAGMYWGQLISYTHGMVDDGIGYRHVPPSVHHLWWVRGEVESYRVRPAFAAFKALLERIPGTRFVARHPARPGTYLLEFERPDDRRLLVAWTRDGLADSLDAYLVGTREGLFIHDVYGRPVAIGSDRLPAVTESPLYVSGYVGPLRPPSEVHLRGALTEYATPESIELAMASYEHGPWRGAIRADLVGTELAERLRDPEAMFRGEGVQMLRDGGRSRMAVVPVPDSCRSAVGAEAMVLKRFPSRLLRRDGRSRAARTWANACEMVSRNVPTAWPIAIIERSTRPWRSESYLLVEKIEGALELRNVLRAYRQGDSPFPGIERLQFVRELATFARNFHASGVWHRDFTAGNVLVRRRENPARPDRQLEFFLLDVSRSRFSIKFRTHLAPLHDLVRVRLAPEDRWPFIEQYAGKGAKARRLWRRYLPRLAVYRLVMALKYWVRPWRWRRKK